MSLSLQPHDHVLISALPVKWRNLVNARVLTLQQLLAGRISKAEALTRLDVSLPTLNRLVREVKINGWAALVPEYKGVGAAVDSRTPEEFIEFLRMLVEKNQRKSAPAFRRLRLIWRTRAPFEIDGVHYDHIPGYAGWPGWPNLPAGWNERTLYRKKPGKLELAAMRQGLGAARSLHGMKVLSTRIGLHHLSHIMFDDVKLDLKCHLAGSRKLVVPLQLGALDLLSGCRFEYGMKPQLYRADGTRDSLNEGDMRFLFCAALRSQGISAKGTTLVVEHGTAAVRGPVRDILHRAFPDLIRVEDSGMIGDIQAIAGTYDGTGGRGTPNHKAALESLHNLVHNELAFLPAQTGHDRNAPEFLGVLERDHEYLWRIAKALPPEAARALKHRTPEYHSGAVPLIRGILHAINCRDDHNLKDWLELGFIRKSYRLMPDSAEWIPEHRLLELAPGARTAILAQADADPRCWQRTRLSPMEVFEMGRAQQNEIVRVPDSVIAEILYQDLAEPRRVIESGEYSGCFAWEDQDLNVSVLAFEGRVTTPHGITQPLARGETYDTVLNPFDTSCLWVFSATRQRGAFLGVAKPVQRICRSDLEAKKEQWKRASKDLHEQLQPLRKRHAATTQQEIERLKFNTRVIKEFRQSSADATADATAALDASLDDHDPLTPQPAATPTTRHERHTDQASATAGDPATDHRHLDW